MEAYSGSPEAMMIGGAIADILLRPVDASVFAQGSTAVDSIRMSVGGDALNESTVLARLGHVPLLVTTDWIPASMPCWSVPPASGVL